jgi:hypothetical protein
MKMRLWMIGFVCLIAATTVGALLTSNPLGAHILREAKARGYLHYSAAEATTLAYNRCTTCHGAEKILQYCSRCGPPFVVVAHTMKKYVELNNLAGEKVKPFSDAELVAITQVWNALVGNWEEDWRRQDIEELLGDDRALLDLVASEPENRPIEMALKGGIAPGSYKEVQSFGRVGQ